MVARRAHRAGGRPGDQGVQGTPATLVESGVPYRGGLLLDPWLHTRHRRTGSRGPLPHSYAPHRGADPLRDGTDVSPGCRGEPARPGLDIYAREVALVLA